MNVRTLLLLLPTLAASSLAWAQSTATPLQGLYVELRPAGNSQVAVHHYFWKDGRYCQGLPAGGLAQEPADPAAIESGLRCGRYRLADQRLNLELAGEQPSYLLRALGGERYELAGNPLSKVPALPSAAGLEGTYTAMVSRSQMTRQIYVFRSDGRYQFSSTPMTSDDGSPINYGGQFRTQGQLLELTGSSAGGATGVEKLTAYPFPGGGLMIDGVVFVR